MEQTVGRLLLKRALPPGISPDREWTKSGVRDLLTEIAEKHPDKYEQVVHDLIQIGKQAAYSDGSQLSLKNIQASQAKQRVLGPIRAQVEAIQESDLPEDEKDRKIVELMHGVAGPLRDALMEEAKQEGNPIGEQIRGGAKGNADNLRSLRAGDLLYDDHNDDPIPVPIFNSYSDGLDPVEYWASTYGARKGLVSVKFATADAGFFGKRIGNAAHRLVVTDDKPVPQRLPVGLPVQADDPDNIGTVLAHPVAGYPAGTVITSSVLKNLKKQLGDKRFLVHSPITSLAENGGIDRWSAGVREKSRMAPVGDNIGLAAAQAIAERISQGMLGAKHGGGVSSGPKEERTGYKYLDRLVEAPATFTQAGMMAPEDGHVQGIEEAPQGGKFVVVAGKRIYVPPHRQVTVKAGDEVEAGDMLTDGIPHPAELVKHKGLGEARRVFTDSMMEGLRNSGITANRRNVELVATGLINHVRVNNVDGIGDYNVDDVVPYSALFAKGYQPRPDARKMAVAESRGKYLEEPVLHYSPGTRVTKKVQADLQEFGVPDVHAHDKPPEFEPHYVRGMMNLYHDPDWMTQLGGFYTGKAFQKSVQHGAASTPKSTSFYPGLATNPNFGESLSETGKY